MPPQMMPVLPAAVPLVPQKQELPPPDPLDPVSVHDENFYYLDSRQRALLSEDATNNFPSNLPLQVTPLPLPLLY